MVLSPHRRTHRYGTEWHGWHPFVDKAVGFVISQAAYCGEMTLETFKCFAEWTGLNHVGMVIASVGAQSVKEFPEYLEQAKELGEAIKKNISMQQNKRS